MAALDDLPVTMRNATSRADFESGVYMGVGTFNLVSWPLGLFWKENHDKNKKDIRQMIERYNTITSSKF